MIKAKKVIPAMELIETLWNVNTNVDNLMAWQYTELIETLWNVNYFCAGDSISATLN